MKFNPCHIYNSTWVTADLTLFVENVIRRKHSHAPNLILTLTKCGLILVYGLLFNGINLGIMRTELKMVVVLEDEVSFAECRAPVTAEREKLSN